MADHGDPGPFTAQDLKDVGDHVLAAWRSGIERDWTAPAGTLEWSCLETADHTIDCVFSYAFFLTSERQDAYPPFGELHTLPGFGPSDMLDGLRAVSTMLYASIVAADPDLRSVITQHPVRTGSPQDFAARGGLELILHAHDVCSGIDVPFVPPADLCGRLYAGTSQWVPGSPTAPTDDPWADLLERSGRPRP